MKAISRILTATLGLCILAAASPAFAQEFGASNLTQKKTYLKSASNDVEFLTTFVPLFSPTQISCAGNSDCFVQVKLDAKIEAVHPSDFITVRVTIDGQRMQPYTQTDLVIDYEIDSFMFEQTRGFTWIQEVKPGTHTILLEAVSHDNFSTIGGRTLSVDVYKQ
jgi:hypothetical protein